MNGRRRLISLAAVVAVVVVTGAAYAARTPARQDVQDTAATAWLTGRATDAIYQVNPFVRDPVPAGVSTVPLGAAPRSALHLPGRLIVVEDGGRAVSFDDATLAHSNATPLAAGDSLATDGDALFALQAGGTSVAALDPRTLDSTGDAASTGPITAWVAAADALWVLTADEVIELRAGGADHIPVHGGTVIAPAAEGVAVLDGDGAVHLLKDGAERRRFALPADARLDGARLAAAEDSDTVALLDDAGRLRVYDPDHHGGGGALDLGTAVGSPLFLSGGQVFVADRDTLRVIRYGHGLVAESPVPVGPAAGLDVIRSGEFVWVNTAGPDAVVVRGGEARHVLKYTLASPTPSASPPPSTIPPPPTMSPPPRPGPPTPTHRTVQPTTRRPRATRTPAKTPTKPAENTHRPPTPGPTTTGKAKDCDGRPTRLSVANRNATGPHPQITVTVCTPPASGHQYWIVDQADDDHRWYVKVRVTHVDGPYTYQVELREDAEKGSGRTFYVVDSTGGGDEVLAGLSRSGEGTDALPSTVTRVSGGVHAVK